MSHQLILRAGVILALFILIPRFGYGQVSSRISRTVRDSGGGAIPGVKVAVTDLDRGTTQQTISNEAGRYAFPTLGVAKMRLNPVSCA